jgi:Neuraminidase (sialidase)
MKTFIGLLLIFFLTSFYSDMNKEVVLQLEAGPDNPRNSEGDFITLKDGSILFIYSHYTGYSGDDDGNAFLAGRYSMDNGKTWTQKDEVIVPQEGKKNVMSVSLLRMQNDEIALFYLVKNSFSDCIPYLRVSTDEAKTWSRPIKCITDKKGYFVLNNNRAIQLKNGRLIIPVALHYCPGGIFDHSVSLNGKIYCYFSDDNGRTWTSSNEVSKPDGIMTQEPGVVELKDGNIVLFMRTYVGVQYASYSKDKGETWSLSVPGNIKSPCSPASIARIPSTGDLLLVWNNNGKNQYRTPYNTAISKNEGKSWEHVKTVENDPDGWYCYTAIHFTDKYILLSYCAGSQSKKTFLSATNIKRLSLDWLYK